MGSVGYDAGSEVSVFSKSYATNFTGSFVNGQPVPGDAAALVRYSTNNRTEKNHPIYLFNYHHMVMNTAGGFSDALHATQKTNLTTFATQWVTGFSDGSVTHHRCGPQGHVATGVLVDQYIRHRDF